MAKDKVLTAVLQLKDKNFSAGLRQGSSGLDKFRRGVYQASDGVDKFGRGAVQGFNRVGQASSTLTKTIVGLGTALLGLKAVDWTKNQLLGGLEAAASLESYRLTLNTVMKDVGKAGEIMKWASKFSAETPFEDEEVIEGTVRLQAYGIEAQKTLRSIGDMASVMNKPLMQAVEAIGDAQTGELERLKEFAITKGMIEKKANEMFKKQEIINKKGQIVDQEKFNEALFALMDDRFKGGMEKQAATYKGLVSTITGTWKTGLAEIVGVTSDGTIRQGSLFEKLKKKADEVSKRFQKWASDGTFKKIGDKLSSMVDKFEDKLPAIKQFFIDLKTPMEIVGNILKEIGKAFKGIVDFANEHPDIAQAIGLTAVGATVAKRLGVFSLGKGIIDTVSNNTVGTQTIKAGVVNVFGAKVNGGNGTSLPDVDVDKNTPGGDTKKKGFWSKLNPFNKGAVTAGATGAVGEMSARSLGSSALQFASRAVIPAALLTGTFFAGSNFDKAKNDPNSIYSSKVLGSGPITQQQPVTKEEYMLGTGKSVPVTSKELTGIVSYLKDSAGKPNNVHVNINMGGVTVKEEADINKLTSQIVGNIKKTMVMQAKPVTRLGGHNPVMRY
ncbi:hypothetical protein [Paenibacillus sp. NPDC093718]|uniref:hypothetical protein n=1 Tax=Paenibacillus sp. NPDC093718 TaxID=3390601 RepID=UPI003CFC7C57